MSAYLTRTTQKQKQQELGGPARIPSEQQTLTWRIAGPFGPQATLLHLQRTAGNQAVSQVIQARLREDQPGSVDTQGQTRLEHAGHSGHSLAPISFSPSSPKRENTTGLPNSLKVSIENLSGMAMDDVHVHYNSSKPAEIQALAYTQGTEIHVESGQEHHLAHEAWHVVQQKQGHVKPTIQAQDVMINNDRGLEREADVMGARALRTQPDATDGLQTRTTFTSTELLSHHLERKGRQTQLQVSPKDQIVQRFERHGNFNVALNPAAVALDTVIGGLSRNARSVLAAYDRDAPHTTLRFATGAIAGNLGLTVFQAHIGGVWHDLDAICTPGDANYHLGLQLNHTTPIRITIIVNSALHNVPPANRQIEATLTHEITVHAIHAYPWLLKLRSGDYLGVQLRGAWRTANQPEALLDVQAEHNIFARGQNRAYNLTAQNVFRNLPAGQQPLYRADIRADMNAHLDGAPFPPPYPI